MKVLVGSANPVKIAATRDVFGEHFGAVEAVGIEVASGVPAQPIGDDTFRGAEGRVAALLALNAARGLAAHFCVGLEGGIQQMYGRWFTFGVACVGDAAGRLGFALSPLVELPAAIVAATLAGEELGHVVDRLSGEHNSKQKGGAIAFLTQGRLDRRTLYAQGLALALVPFLNAGLYFAATPLGDA